VSGIVRPCCSLPTFGPDLATSPLLGTLLILLAGASVQTQPFADIDVSVHVPVVLRLSSIKRPMLGNALRSWGTPKVLVEAGGRPVSPNWGLGGAYLVCNEDPKLHTKPCWFLYAVSGPHYTHLSSVIQYLMPFKYGLESTFLHSRLHVYLFSTSNHLH